MIIIDSDILCSYPEDLERMRSKLQPGVIHICYYSKRTQEFAMLVDGDYYSKYDVERFVRTRIGLNPSQTDFWHCETLLSSICDYFGVSQISDHTGY